MKKSLLSIFLCLVCLSAFAKKNGKFGIDTVVQKGLVQMASVRASGSVLLYVVNGKKAFPAVETSDYGSSNYISIYDGSREFRLNKKNGGNYVFEADENSIAETFAIDGLAELKASYTISKESEKDEVENCVLVKYTLKNLSEKKISLALKSVYNLRLGENRSFHFSSSKKNEINSEYVAFPSKEENWIISSDSQNAVEFIIFGKGVTSPKRAVLANKDVIELAAPDASFSPGNSFDSILSYNNSSLGLFWEPVELKEGESRVYSYKIVFSVNDFQNSGKPVFVQEEAAALPPVEEKAAPEKKEEAASENFADLDSIDPSKLNAEYVQQLINHINSLEQSDPSLNRIKIQQLQTEVDEVLQVLRSRK
mgnify:CR=1 FL=1